MLSGLTKRLQKPVEARRIAPTAIALAAVLLPASALAADEPPPPTGSAVSQYAELVPTGAGAKAPGVGKKTQASLPAKAKKALAKEPAKTASALTEVATSSDYGAPTPSPERTKPTTKAQEIPSPAEPPSLDRTLAATAAAAAPVDDARMIVLLLALVGIAVAGGVLSARSHRS